MIKNNEITWWFSEVLEAAETDEKAENCVISNKVTSNKQEIRQRAIFLDFQLKKFILTLSFGCCSADAICFRNDAQWTNEPTDLRRWNI